MSRCAGWARSHVAASGEARVGKACALPRLFGFLDFLRCRQHGVVQCVNGNRTALLRVPVRPWYIKFPLLVVFQVCSGSDCRPWTLFLNSTRIVSGLVVGPGLEDRRPSVKSGWQKTANVKELDSLLSREEIIRKQSVLQSQTTWLSSTRLVSPE